jgi:hypothetical protein
MFVLVMEYLVLSKTASLQVIGSTLLLLLGTLAFRCLRHHFLHAPCREMSPRFRDTNALVVLTVAVVQGRLSVAGAICISTPSATHSRSV